MLRGKHGVVLLCGTVVVLVLSACATPAPALQASATPAGTLSVEPRSNVQMVNSAIALFRHYVQLSNTIAESDSTPVSSLKPLLSAEQYASDMADLNRLRASGQRISGPAEIRSYKVQAVQPELATAAIYVCLDEARARVLDSAGHDVTPRARPSDVTLIVKFAGLTQQPEIVSSDRWSGSSVC